jgi:fucose permease
MSYKSQISIQLILLHTVYFASGIATVLIVQVLPIFSNQFTLSDLQASYFFPSQFFGSLCGTLLSSLLARRDNYLYAAVVGAASMAAGLLVLNGGTYATCLTGFYVLGLGVGLSLPSINMMVVKANPDRSASALSVLNFCWGLGAIVCKPYIDAFSTKSSVGLSLYVLMLPLVVLAVMLSVGALKIRRSAVVHIDEAAAIASIWTHPAAWAIAGFNFLHVGFESGMGGWLTTYSTRMPEDGWPIWLSPTLLYFLFFVSGRGVAPLLFRFADENRMLLLGLCLVLAGMSLTILAVSLPMLGVGASIAGFGTSWIFPTNVSRFSRTFGEAALRKATPLFMAGTFGAAMVTWFIGYVSDHFRDLRYGMFVLGSCVVILLIIQLGLAARGRRTSPAKV